MTSAEVTAHVDLDGAWPEENLSLQRHDFTNWGPRLRFCAPDVEMESFYRAVAAALPATVRFIAYGSGDFHHLSALWLRRAVEVTGAEKLTLISFDNHPDWDIRPPKWCCGSWINRALDIPTVDRVSVWGCGNFECWGWHRVWGNHRDVNTGRLEVHAWADGRSTKDRAKSQAIQQATWRDKFRPFAESLVGRHLYITVDIDGLTSDDAVTNWENGRFAATDVAWAIQELARHGTIVAGDLCGARSEPTYARRTQKFASETDHPTLPIPGRTETVRINTRTFHTIWPALTAGTDAIDSEGAARSRSTRGDEHHASGD